MTELSGPLGSGKTECTLTLLKEALKKKPNAQIAWIESKWSLFPPAFLQNQIPLHQVLFASSPEHSTWIALEALRSGIFDWLIFFPSALSEIDLRRLQLETERARVSTIILGSQPLEVGTWTLRLRLAVKRDAQKQSLILQNLRLHERSRHLA
jgi:hypothetical protein